MSIRHQMRAKVEELFRIMIDRESFPKEEETTVYVVFVPVSGDFEEEEIEVSEQEVDPQDSESVKRFLDRTTREALEADVKGLKLFCYVYEGSEGLSVVATEEGDSRKVLEHIERMREEV